MKEIDKNLKRIALRLRMARGLRGSAIGSLAGAIIATVLALLDQSGTYYTSWAVLSACFATTAILGAVLGYMLPIDRMKLADSVDRRLGLRNRLRTALEDDEGDFHRAVVEDAEKRLTDVRNRNAFPLRLSRWHAGAALCMAVACGIFLLGNTPLFLSDAEKAERQELKAAAEQIRRVAKPVLENTESSLAEERELAERLEKLAKDLERGRMSKKEALAKANELSEKAQELAKSRNRDAEKAMTAADAMKRAADKKKLEAAGLEGVDMSQVDKSHEALNEASEDLKAKIEDLQKKLSNSDLTKSEREALESQLKEAQEALKQIELSKKAKDFLGRLQSHPAYKELLEMAQKINQSAKEGGGKQLTEEEIKKMIERLEELADQFKTDEDLRKFIEEMKKALAECKGACAGLGLGAGLASLLPSSGRSKDMFFANTGVVNKTEKEQDIKATTQEHAVRGERGERGKETHIEIMGPSAAGERTKTPYTTLLPKYKKSAESAINRQQIPKSQQKRVREYFESLSGGK